MKNERTSARVAKIAGKVLAFPDDESTYLIAFKGKRQLKIRWSEIRALAASALTQAPDKPKYELRRILKRPVVGVDGEPLNQAHGFGKAKRRRPVDRARAAFRENIEATATSPDDDRPKRKAKR